MRGWAAGGSLQLATLLSRSRPLSADTSAERNGSPTLSQGGGSSVVSGARSESAGSAAGRAVVSQRAEVIKKLSEVAAQAEAERAAALQRRAAEAEAERRAAAAQRAAEYNEVGIVDDDDDMVASVDNIDTGDASTLPPHERLLAAAAKRPTPTAASVAAAVARDTVPPQAATAAAAEVGDESADESQVSVGGQRTGPVRGRRPASQQQQQQQPDASAAFPAPLASTRTEASAATSVAASSAVGSSGTAGSVTVKHVKGGAAFFGEGGQSATATPPLPAAAVPPAAPGASGSSVTGEQRRWAWSTTPLRDPLHFALQARLQRWPRRRRRRQRRSRRPRLRCACLSRL